jgi:hypothetical protein
VKKQFFKTSTYVFLPREISLQFMTTGGTFSLKGQCHKIFKFSFLHGSVSPKPLIVPLGPFQKICGDLRSSRCTNGVVDIGGKWKKSSIRKIFILFF